MKRIARPNNQWELRHKLTAMKKRSVVFQAVALTPTPYVVACCWRQPAADNRSAYPSPAAFNV
jgi:hypothetical protein